jgi:hypothetical protein
MPILFYFFSSRCLSSSSLYFNFVYNQCGEGEVEIKKNLLEYLASWWWALLTFENIILNGHCIQMKFMSWFHNIHLICFVGSLSHGMEVSAPEYINSALYILIATSRNECLLFSIIVSWIFFVYYFFEKIKEPESSRLYEILGPIFSCLLLSSSELDIP